MAKYLEKDPGAIIDLKDLIVNYRHLAEDKFTQKKLVQRFFLRSEFEIKFLSNPNKFPNVEEAEL